MQESAVDAQYYQDRDDYFKTLAPQAAAGTAALAILSAAPSSARPGLYSAPDFLWASVAQAQPSDRPSWFNAMPTAIQDFYSSVGRKNIEIYTSDLKVVDPTALIDSSMLPSTRINSGDLTITATIDAHAAATQAVKSVAAISPHGRSSSMAVAVTGVVLAASLTGLAML